MKKEWRHPFWENYQKDRITCKLVITHENGEVTSSTSTVSKYDKNGEITKDYNDVIAATPVEKINKNTEEREQRHKDNRLNDKRKQAEREAARKLEQLFNAKLEVFEIESIKSSTNRKAKSKIRRSKNQYEMMAYAIMLIQEEDAKNESK
jgi:hypothetical protein|tara:strand:- start:147 stop:596 length:450 start_codon:yes stop_codon:yes gene_type:complete